MKTKILLICFAVLLLATGTTICAQTNADTLDMKRLITYSTLLNDLNCLNRSVILTDNTFMGNSLSRAKYDANHADKQITDKKVTEINGCSFVSLTFYPKFVEDYSKCYWLFKDGNYYKVNKDNVVEIINEYLYRGLAESDKDELIDLYNEVVYSTRGGHIADIEDKGILPMNIDEPDYYRRYKTFKVTRNSYYECWLIKYEFYWNRFVASETLEERK